MCRPFISPTSVTETRAPNLTKAKRHLHNTLSSSFHGTLVTSSLSTLKIKAQKPEIISPVYASTQAEEGTQQSRAEMSSHSKRHTFISSFSAKQKAGKHQKIIKAQPLHAIPVCHARPSLSHHRSLANCHPVSIAPFHKSSSFIIALRRYHIPWCSLTPSYSTHSTPRVYWSTASRKLSP